MLSATLENIGDAKFPLLASPKIDGIRCLMMDGKCVSRTFKPIPNNHVRSNMEALLAQYPLDGELMVKDAAFNGVQSGIMRKDGEPNFEYWVFDHVSDLSTPYYKRMEELGKLHLPKFCKKVLPVMVNNAEELTLLEENWLAQGFEGVMLRSVTSPYKNGRSSLNEHYLLKLKQFKDSEAVVIGFEELLHNENEAIEDELGHSVRSSHKANMVPANTLGKFLIVEVGDTPWKGKEFAIGTGLGLTAELRKEIWSNQDQYVGKIVKYRYQSHGVKELPRIPIWLGFRHPDDMGDV